MKLKALTKKDLSAAALLCAESMLDNPLHIQVFGSVKELRLRRLSRFFPGLLTYVYKKGQLEGAFVEGRLVGVMGVLPPECCMPSAFEGLQLLPAMMRSNSVLGWWRLAMWLGTWAKLDPKEAHWHLGPLAVHPEYRRQGIGSALFTQALSKPQGYPFYLETDLLRNVQLYEQFGFEVVASPNILNTPSWLMMKN